MNKSEVAKVLYVIRAAYPRFFNQVTDAEAMVNAWWYVLREYSARDVNMGLKVYLDNDELGFPPSPVQILTMVRRVKDQPVKELTAAEAWQVVWDAITSLRWESPEQEFNKLPYECRRALGSAESLREIAMMDTDSVMIGEKARFMRQYEAIREREKDFTRIPQAVREAAGVAAGERPAIADEVRNEQSAG